MYRGVVFSSIREGGGGWCHCVIFVCRTRLLQMAVPDDVRLRIAGALHQFFCTFHVIATATYVIRVRC